MSMQNFAFIVDAPTFLVVARLFSIRRLMKHRTLINMPMRIVVFFEVQSAAVLMDIVLYDIVAVFVVVVVVHTVMPLFP